MAVTNPFNSTRHRPVAPGKCLCGQGFDSTYELDIHILGPELAAAVHRDRTAAMESIVRRAAEMAETGPVASAAPCGFGCFGGNNDFDCPVHGGMQGGGA